MLSPRDGVLLSWVDLNNDPYRPGDPPEPGPTLTVLFDPDSPYHDRIGQVVLFYRTPSAGARPHEDYASAQATRQEIEKRSRGAVMVEIVAWAGNDPTDHRGLFTFLEAQVAALEARFVGRPFVIHISPGTPAMQTVWVLMAEVGMIRPPFTVVKSVRRAFRGGQPAVVPVRLDIPTFYKAFRGARPQRTSAAEETVRLDPRQFVSPRLIQLYIDAHCYAQLNVPVLILGERGTGKTTLASWIRSNSRFRKPELDHAWPSVPCSQYSSETMRAELFGYVKGAFTDAKEDTEGLLHAADGDTLFLDEIGDISRDLQRLLIRALEEKRFTRVGARRPERSSFRLITATNLPWSQLKQRLDPDFLDRISAFQLDVPPLRDVRADLPGLWRQVFYQALLRAEIAADEVPLDPHQHTRIVDHLSAHPLPGNLRDLFRIAYQLIACHMTEERREADPVSYALRKGLRQEADAGAFDHVHAIAAAFAFREPLTGLLERDGTLQTKQLERTLHQYLATELRRIGKERGVNPGTLCDVVDRTLLKWLKGEEDVTSS